MTVQYNLGALEGELQSIAEARNCNSQDIVAKIEPEFQPILDGITRSRTIFDNSLFGSDSSSQTLDASNLIRIEIASTLNSDALDPAYSAISNAQSSVGSLRG